MEDFEKTIVERDGPFTFYICQNEIICVLDDKKTGETYVGKSKCHPDDIEVKSKLIGQHIALERALIKALKGALKEMKKEYKVLLQFYHTINYSKKFDPKSYIAKMLICNLKMRENQIEYLKESIEIKNDDLRKYISDKEKAHQRLKKIRASKDKND